MSLVILIAGLCAAYGFVPMCMTGFTGLSSKFDICYQSLREMMCWIVFNHVRHLRCACFLISAFIQLLMAGIFLLLERLRYSSWLVSRVLANQRWVISLRLRSMTLGCFPEYIFHATIINWSIALERQVNWWSASTIEVIRRIEFVHLH